MNIPTTCDDFTRENLHFSLLKTVAQNTPNMTVKVTKGQFWSSGTMVEFPGGNSAALTPPTTDPKIVVIGVKTGGIFIVDGDENANPVLPSVDETIIPLAAVVLQTATTEITESMIFDLRPYLQLAITNFAHNNLTDKDAADAHTISSITDLQTELNLKVSATTLASQLTNKADTSGAPSTSFTLNSGFAGAPVSDVSLTVNRGSEDDKSIKWEENEDNWEVDEDINIASTQPTTDLKGIILSTDAGVKYRVTLNTAGDGFNFTAI